MNPACRACPPPWAAQVGEIGKLIDWAQNTSPLPPVLGGRASPAGYSSLLGGRCAAQAGSGQARQGAARPLSRLVAACVVDAQHGRPQSPPGPCAPPGRRLSFGGGGGGGVMSPLAEATNQLRASIGSLPHSAGPRPKATPGTAPPSLSPSKRLQVPSPAGRTPVASPTKVR